MDDSTHRRVAVATMRACLNHARCPTTCRGGRAAATTRSAAACDPADCGVATSPRETRVRLLLVRAGIPEPELKPEVEVLGHLVHPDLVWRDRRVVLEYEGDGHRGSEQFRYDIDRYELLQEHGGTVHRAKADDLSGPKAAALVRRIRSALS